MSLITEDISSPSLGNAHRTISKRTTNPLDPVYALPSSIPGSLQAVAIRNPLRFSNFVEDIEGARPRHLTKQYRSRTYDPMSNLDIAGSSPMRRTKQLRASSATTIHHALCVDDINNDWRRKAKPRSGNPLEPIYSFRFTSDDTPAVIGPIQGSRPRSYKSYISHIPKAEIQGSKPQRFVGTLPHSTLTSEKNIKTWHHFQSDPIFIRGLVTNRRESPLDPKYILLDGSRDSSDIILAET